MSRGKELGTALLALAIFGVASATTTAPTFTMCVPEVFWKDCLKMIQDSAASGIPIACISGRDRFDCIDKVGRKEADIVAVDPEDMYLALKSNLAASAGFKVVEQVRTKEEPQEPYRYEAVAVVHKDLNIDNVQGLRGLKSCHTGVGRNVGYKIPITKLTAMGVLNMVHDPEYSARENELRALSSLFDKGCLVGTWSPDPAINHRLKETYSNMCALCERPDVCDYPDIYSGYEGALRCLAHNGGDVAWTKVIFVKRFFGLPVGVSEAKPTNENPEDFRYFCPDGSKVRIDANTKPCTWAARPWQGYMINDGVKNVDAVQKELTDLGQLGENEKAPWWKDLMLLNEKTLAVKTHPETPEQHLTDAKYLDVIERNSGAPKRKATICVWNDDSMQKCRAWASAAYSRDARPGMDCVEEQNEDGCLKKLREGGADMVIIDGGSVLSAVRDSNAKPIVSETYGEGSTHVNERPAVAVVKKGSSINALGDLRGKKSCHSGYEGDFAGWAAPVHALKKAGLIHSPQEMADFFSASCAPGAPHDSKLCQQCVGNTEAADDITSQATKCKRTNMEAFNGGKGALKCLIADKGDVAFVPLTALKQMDKGDNAIEGAKASDFMLVCPNGGLATVEEADHCNLGLEPPRIIVSSATKSANALEELTHGVLAASNLYAEDPDLLQLFGRWGDQSNVLFKDDTVGLASVDKAWNPWSAWAETQHEYGTA